MNALVDNFQVPGSAPVEKIISVHRDIKHFWSNVHGWAPDAAAELLAKARLDWLYSLSVTLRLWLRPDGEELSDGELILAWVNLGSLVEGVLQLYLTVHYLDYLQDLDGQIGGNKLFKHKGSGEKKKPEDLTFEALRQFVTEKELFPRSHLKFLEAVQQRRNAIHAFNSKDLGNAVIFREAISTYQSLLIEVESRLPEL